MACGETPWSGSFTFEMGVGEGKQKETSQRGVCGHHSVLPASGSLLPLFPLTGTERLNTALGYYLSVLFFQPQERRCLTLSSKQEEMGFEMAVHGSPRD